MLTAATALAANPLWYVSRATGLVAFVLLTVTFALGLASTKRALASPAWPRFATQHLHRNISLLALGALVVHVASTVLDGFVHVGWLAVVLPGASGYRPFAVGLGALAFDAVIALVVTSLLRLRLSARTWRGVHWAAYGAWPLAFLHFLRTGTDAAHGRWGLYLAGGSLALLAAATAVRWLTGDRAGRPRSVAGRPA